MIYPSHFRPPFFSGWDDIHRVEYPAEATFQRLENSGNYGTGGYYGNTYRQEERESGPMSRKRQPRGYPDGYRHLGDRRQPLEPQRAWNEEYGSRHGYRTLDERINKSQGHRGKGPRSYRRPDGRILEELNDRLCDDPFLNASEIETAVEQGEIILSGTVDGRQDKRRAEDIAESVSGVVNVQNRLRVKEPGA